MKTNEEIIFEILDTILDLVLPILPKKIRESEHVEKIEDLMNELSENLRIENL